MPLQPTIVPSPSDVDHRWLRAGTGWYAVVAYALAPHEPDSDLLNHRTYAVAAWQLCTDECGARHGVPVVARGGQLAALVPLDLLTEHVEVGQVVGGRSERSAALTALARRAYGALERRRAAAVGR